tara:strand:+ start:5476 stop:5943 length:468 start_codon:yes stop_codon:yes gene_type:complete
MKKPNSLKAYLLQCIQPLRSNPELLQVFIDKGGLNCKPNTSLSFEYHYSIQLLLTDFGGHPNSVFVPLLAWLKINQPDIDREAIDFDAEILRNDLVDLSISVPLTERVKVTTDDQGNHSTEHLDEPQPEENLPPPDAFLTLNQGDEQLTPEEPAA